MSCYLRSTIMIASILVSASAYADSQFDRCLVEATNKNAQDYSCDKYLEKQDENMALDTSAKQMYLLCLKQKDQAATAAAEKCRAESAPAPADDLTTAPSGPKQAAKSPTEPPKDTSKPKTDTTPKTASTPKSDKLPTTPAKTPTTSVADAQAQIQSDLSSCNQYQSQASKCCNNPLSCAGSLSQADQQSLAQLMNGPQQGQSMTDYCNQMKQQSANQSSVNNGLANTCASPQSSCSSTCASMANKYINLANQNLGTELESVYISAADQLGNAASTCDNLRARASQLAAQGISGGGTQSMSQACQTASAQNPTIPGGSGSNPVVPTSPATQARLDATVNCVANPAAAECVNQNKGVQGTTGFDSDSKTNGNFNVADAPTPQPDYFSQSTQSQAPGKNGTVPNSSGGTFGSNTNGTSANLNDRNTRRVANNPSYTTDIMQGTMSGGGYTYGGSGSGLDDGGSGSSWGARLFGSRKKAKDEHGGLLGMDLRQFLPGGTRDPRRAIAGFNGHSEINSKEEDIWKRISIKMVEKCKLGVLWRCE